MAAAGSSDPPKVEAAAAAAAGGGERADDVGRRGDQASFGGGVQKKAKRERLCTAKERISRMPPCAAGKRSSIYRGVTRHRWTGRYEAHLWDKSTWNQNQNKKGKQVYLGAYDDEEAAARAYDLAALKYWGAGTLINFPVTDYTRDLEEMQIVTKEDYLVSLRRKSSAFSRGLTKYRGVTSLRQTQGRWETSYGQLTGNDYFNNLNCSTSRDPSTQGKLAVGFGMERKIDLTSYIRWWGPKKTRQVDSTSSTTAEDVSRELRALECSTQATEPYQLPSLGFSSIKGKHAPLQQSHSMSACSILSQSAAFKNLLVKSSETREDISNKERDRAEGLPEMFAGSGGLDSSGISILGMDQFHGQRTPYTLAPLLAGQLTTSWNPVDPVLPADPALWASLVPPTGQQSLGTTAIKNEISSTAYTSYQCQD